MFSSLVRLDEENQKLVLGEFFKNPKYIYRAIKKFESRQSGLQELSIIQKNDFEFSSTIARRVPLVVPIVSSKLSKGSSKSPDAKELFTYILVYDDDTGTYMNRIGKLIMTGYIRFETLNPGRTQEYIFGSKFFSDSIGTDPTQMSHILRNVTRIQADDIPAVFMVLSLNQEDPAPDFRILGSNSFEERNGLIWSNIPDWSTTYVSIPHEWGSEKISEYLSTLELSSPEVFIDEPQFEASAYSEFSTFKYNDEIIAVIQKISLSGVVTEISTIEFRSIIEESSQVYNTLYNELYERLIGPNPTNKAGMVDSKMEIMEPLLYIVSVFVSLLKRVSVTRRIQINLSHYYLNDFSVNSEKELSPIEYTAIYFEHVIKNLFREEYTMFRSVMKTRPAGLILHGRAYVSGELHAKLPAKMTPWVIQLPASRSLLFGREFLEANQYDRERGLEKKEVTRKEYNFYDNTGILRIVKRSKSGNVTADSKSYRKPISSSSKSNAAFYKIQKIVKKNKVSAETRWTNDFLMTAPEFLQKLTGNGGRSGIRISQNALNSLGFLRKKMENDRVYDPEVTAESFHILAITLLATLCHEVILRVPRKERAELVAHINSIRYSSNPKLNARAKEDLLRRTYFYLVTKYIPASKRGMEIAHKIKFMDLISVSQYSIDMHRVREEIRKVERRNTYLNMAPDLKRSLGLDTMTQEERDQFLDKFMTQLEPVHNVAEEKHQEIEDQHIDEMDMNREGEAQYEVGIDEY